MKAVCSLRHRARVVGSAIALGVAGLAVFTSPSLADSRKPSLLGLWSRADGSAHVKVERCAQRYCAVSTWVKPGNSDDKPGDRLVMNLTLAQPAVWEGEAFDPQHNINYRLRIQATGREATLHGCLGTFCKDTSWTRF